MRRFSLGILCLVILPAVARSEGNVPCTDPCLSCDACYESGSILGAIIGPDGLIKPSDHCFDNFISPMTNPVFFEDPRTLTEARFIFMNHEIPGSVAGGGDVQVYAMQLRAALTDDISLIATKDGYIISDFPLMNDGFADVSIGLKANVWKDACAQQIVSVGAMFELPIGSTQALQGNGDGEFNIFASAGTQVLGAFHYVTASGFRLPTNATEESQVWYWSNHLDLQVRKTGFYLFGETNWYHWMRSGQSFPVAIEGIDLINLGSVGVAGNDIVTGALGVKYKPSCHTEIGLAWEVPLTDRRDIMDDRLTFDWIFRY